MAAKLKIGSGLHRARKNRSRGPRPAKVRTIYFEDKGQDFLWWTIDSTGLVVDCGPFQASTWCKCRVLGAQKINVGEHVQISTPWDKDITLNYAITKIEDGAYPHPGTKGISPVKFLKLLKAPRHVVAAPQPLRLRPVSGAQPLPPLPQPIIARAGGRRS